MSASVTYTWRQGDVTDWPFAGPEGDGIRAKVWVSSPDGSRWLRKHRRESRPAEPVIESIALQLARASGLEAPEAMPAIWRTKHGDPPCTSVKIGQHEREQRPCDSRLSGGACTGIVVQSFLAENDEIRAGGAYIEPYVRGYDPATQEYRSQHSLSVIRQALEDEERRYPGADLLTPFARLVTFDAWIGNCDRHQGGNRYFHQQLSEWFRRWKELAAPPERRHPRNSQVARVDDQCRKVACSLRYGARYYFLHLPRFHSRGVALQTPTRAAPPTARTPSEMAGIVQRLKAMPMRIHRELFVLWRDPADGSRLPVGRLWLDRERGEYCFGYAHSFAEAKARGFSTLPEMPDTASLEQPARSRSLFSTFSRRIPTPARPDYRTLLDSWGVTQADDPLEILARSGGVLLTDRIEFAEYRGEDDDLSTPLEFRVAGSKYLATELPDVREGDRLSLRRVPENSHDSNATLVLARGDEPIGYVPRQYSALFARLIDSGKQVHADAVRHLMLPAETGRWVVRAYVDEGRKD